MISLKQFCRLRKQLIECSEEFNNSNNTQVKFDNLINELPHGSGIDSGMKLIEDRSNFYDKVVFSCDFHHLNEHGYDGWSEHFVTITSRFDGIYIHVSGKDKRQIKSYLRDMMYEVFTD